MSRSLKEIIDYSTFTDPKTSHDLYSNSIRRGFEFDAYGDRDTFQAVVLTNPIPTDPKQINLFTGGETDGSEKISQFTYRARIIGVNSPHDFLPDPCDSTYTDDPVQAEKLIAMHTLFVSKEEDGVGSSLPRKGSTVEVKLTKNVFSYNLQIGEHLKVVSNPQQSSANNAECTSLQAIINNTDASSLSSFYSGENQGGPEGVDELYNYWIENYADNISAPKDGECGGLYGYEVTKCVTVNVGGVNVTLHPIFAEQVLEVYNAVSAQNFPNESLRGGSGLRTIREQMSLRIQKSRKLGFERSYEQLLKESSGGGLFSPQTAPIPTETLAQGSRHLYGLAIDFGGILAGTSEAERAAAKRTKTYKFMIENYDSVDGSGFKNYSKEPWHWSPDGR